jgi:hypothetical protein
MGSVTDVVVAAAITADRKGLTGGKMSCQSLSDTRAT